MNSSCYTEARSGHSFFANRKEQGSEREWECEVDDYVRLAWGIILARHREDSLVMACSKLPSATTGEQQVTLLSMQRMIAPMLTDEVQNCSFVKFGMLLSD